MSIMLLANCLSEINENEVFQIFLRSLLVSEPASSSGSCRTLQCALQCAVLQPALFFTPQGSVAVGRPMKIVCATG